MIGRALVAVIAAAIALVVAIAARPERIWGEPVLRYEVTIPDEAVGRARAIEAIWRRRLRAFDVTIASGPDRPGPAIAQVAVRGATRADADVVARALDATGALAMVQVVHGTEAATVWFEALGAGRDAPRADGVRAEMDYWTRPDGTGVSDPYVMGPTREAIAAALATLPPPDPGLALVYEDVSPPPEAENHAPYVRTYLVDPAPFITGADVAQARVTYDEYANRPEVMVTFTRDGAERFAAATERSLGAKLAILVDGEVRSAPVVNGVIRGGRVTITMGGSDRQAQEKEAWALVATLRGGTAEPLPPGLQATLTGAEARDGARWPTRLGFALVAGALAWLVIALLARRSALAAAPLGVRPFIGFGAPRWLATLAAAAITIAIPAALVYASHHLFLPRLTLDFRDMVTLSGGSAAHASVFALGVWPVIAAFWLAELVAMAVPGWRTARLGDPAGRRAIDRLALALAVALAATQAWFLLEYLEGLGVRGVPAIEGGWLARVAIVATLIGGVMVHLVAAELITRHGLANGLLVLAATSAALALWNLHPLGREPDGPAPEGLVFLAVALAVIGLAAGTSRLRHGTGARLPWTGVVPVVALPVAIAIGTLPAMFWPASSEWTAHLLDRPRWIDPVVALILAVLLVERRRTERTPLAPYWLSLAWVGALIAAPLLVHASLRPAFEVLGLAAIGVAAVELVVGVRARLRLAGATTVAVVHDVDRADELAAALAAAGLDHVVQGVHARAVLRGFGAYCPIVLRVAANDAEAARVALEDVASSSP